MEESPGNSCENCANCSEYPNGENCTSCENGSNFISKSELEEFNQAEHEIEK